MYTRIHIYRCTHVNVYVYTRLQGGSMKTLAILSRKGGTGKTTLAVHLSVEAERAGKTTALIDLDPQASAVRWSDTRDEDSPTVISAHSTRLPQILNTAEKNGVDIAILDTAPHTEAHALDAAKAADYGIIPCRDAIFDLQAIGSTVQIVDMAELDSCVVFNAVPARSSMIEQAKQAVEVYDVPCAPVTLGNRVAFSHAVVDGKTATECEPNGKASKEVKALYKYISKEMGV